MYCWFCLFLLFFCSIPIQDRFFKYRLIVLLIGYKYPQAQQTKNILAPLILFSSYKHYRNLIHIHLTFGKRAGMPDVWVNDRFRILHRCIITNIWNTLPTRYCAIKCVFILFTKLCIRICILFVKYVNPFSSTSLTC